MVVACVGMVVLATAPQWLEARTRSRLSTAHKELRRLAVAVEAYQADYETYPITDTGDMERQNFRRFEEWQKTRATVSLSTPVAYIDNGRIADPFVPPLPSGQSGGYLGFASGNTDGGLNNQGQRECPYNVLTGPNSGDYSRFWPADVWVLVSSGPNGVYETGISEFPFSRGLIYDPTNGLISQGDVVVFGPNGRGPRGYTEETSPPFISLPIWDNCEW